MNRAILLLSIMSFLYSVHDAEAQSIRSLMKKKIIEDNLKAQAERDSIRAVEEGREPDKSPNTTMTHVYMDAFGLSDNVEYESKYDFDAYIQMDITRYNKKGKVENQSVYDSYVNRESVDYAMEFTDNQSRTIVIYDFAESVMLMLSESDGEKTGFAMGFDEEAMTERIESAVQDAETEHPFDLRKTGKTKMILGYTCEEYFGDDETTEVRMWVSEKLAKEVRREMLYNQQYFGGTFHHAAYVNGMVMEYDYLDKEEGERVVMQVTDIDLNRPHSISTREYAVLTMQQSEEEEE